MKSNLPRIDGYKTGTTSPHLMHLRKAYLLFAVTIEPSLHVVTAPTVEPEVVE